MPIATPSISVTVTPPGGSPANYSSYLTYAGSSNEITITQNFGRQGDTATIVLVDEYVTTPHIGSIPVMSQISLYDNNIGVTLFAGVVNDPLLEVSGPNRNEWHLNCTDYTFYADNSTPVVGIFNNQTADQIIIALTSQANCGISAARVSAGGFVAPGPLLPSVQIQYQSLSSAWKLLAQLAGQVTPYGWYVDEVRRLHFYDSTTAINTGVTFTTTPTVGGSQTEGHMIVDSQNTYEWDGSTVHNRILVQGATQLLFPNTNLAATDQWLANGTQNAWPLRYTFAAPILLRVSGTIQSVNVVPPGGPLSSGSTPTASWNVIENTSGQFFLTANTAPDSGDPIKFWYSYKIPVTAQVNDAASQATYTGPNGGIFGEYINDTSLTTTTMALTRAMRERQEYSFAVERCVFNTSQDWVGYLRSGQVFTYINQYVPNSESGYALGVNDTFLCTQNRITFGRGGYRTMQITGVRL